MELVSIPKPSWGIIPCPDEKGTERHDPRGHRRGNESIIPCPDEKGTERQFVNAVLSVLKPRIIPCPDEKGTESVKWQVIRLRDRSVSFLAPMKRGLKVAMFCRSRIT